MRLLVLSFYYPPDLCAGSFRTEALICALEKYRSQGLKVDILTTQPNRYSNITVKRSPLEDNEWLRIHRFNIPKHKSGMFDQSKAFLRYAQNVKKISKNGQWNMVFATSSRLMTAALGAHIARSHNIPLYLDIRDIFTDTISDILGKRAFLPFLKIFKWIERSTFKSATRINVVSAGFLDHVQQIVPDHNCSVYTNGIDKDFLSQTFDKKSKKNNEKIVLYAGNIGEGQGLHHILPCVAKALSGKVRFRIIGDGGRLPQLKSEISAMGVTNIELCSPIVRDQLLIEYKEADILFLHLNDYPAFAKVIPSKLFEYGATGKPIIAGVAGYPAEFIKNELPSAVTFAPCDVNAMIKVTNSVLNKVEKIDNQEFCKRYFRAVIMDKMCYDIIETYNKTISNKSTTHRKVH